MRSPLLPRFSSGLSLLAACGVVFATSALADERRPPPQNRFKPTLLSGQPVKVTGTITHNFTLQRRGPEGSHSPAPSRGEQQR